MKRIYQSIITDHFLSNKQMAFLCGPRQVGKTTIARALQQSKEHSLYRTWDSPEDRSRLLSPSYAPVLEGLTLSPATHPLVIFDEIHKFPEWKNYLKGFFDLYNGQMDVLVTGSARLNIYRKGNDSLMGRYFLYHVHPLTLAEKADRPLELFQEPTIIPQDTLQALLKFGGFPEPFNKASDRFSNKWQQLRHQQLIYDDIRSLEAIQNLAQLDLLATLLQHQAGQLVNYTSLAKKVRVSVPTIQRWVSALEQVFFCYTLRPWTKNVTRSLLKEPKIYLWDWSLIADLGARCENFVASHLLKAVHFWQDIGLGRFDLHFIRTKDQEEVDFLVTKDEKPWMLFEVKASSNSPLSKSLQDFKAQLDCPYAFQVVFDLPSNNRALDWLSEHLINEKPAPPVILPVEAIFSVFV